MILFLIFAQQLSAQKLISKNTKQYWKISKATAPSIQHATSLYKIETGITPNFYTTQTGFFCNQERAFEKKTKIPLKLRLGSLSYTEQMEGY
ncbi:MAG: hypothetical protein KA534_00270 [Sediminibacterium sp.]|nr:hypothetical protein [Sediminibacterium sp.]